MSKMKVLIVEDDKDILQLLSYNMQASGFDVLTSRDGFDALSVARQNLPDLILLDLMLPNLDGFEVCKELKRDLETKNIPILMLTAVGQATGFRFSMEKDGYWMKADDFADKPLPPGELVERIRRLIAEAAAGKP